MNSRRRTLVTASVLVALGLLAVACLHRARRPAPATAPQTTSREHGVAEHSRDVMPFDLTRTTHVFEPTPDGLVETVTTNPPVDPAQVALIRDHLAHEAEAFAAGNFDDPARIHGDDMPGLAEMRADPAGLTVRYADVPAGGRITYTSADPVLVDALHRFGAAQRADHNHEHGH